MTFMEQVRELAWQVELLKLSPVWSQAEKIGKAFQP